MFPHRMPVSFTAYVAMIVAFLCLALFWLAFSLPTVRAQSQPEALGSLSGTVTNANGDPLPGMTVTLEQYADDPNYPKQSATSDAAGNYHFLSVFPGIYRVKFSDPAGVYADRFYVDAIMADDATSVAVGGNSVENIDTKLVPGGSISVTLVTSQPLTTSTSLETTLYRQSSGGRWQSYRTLVQNESTGNHLYLAGLPYGRYRLCVRLFPHAGTSNYLCYENLIPQFTESIVEGATDIVVESAETVLVTLDFVKNSLLQGYILSPNGEPLPGIMVRLVPVSHMIFYDTVTDAQGRFDFGSYPYGNHLLIANIHDGMDESYAGAPYVTTFYPNVFEFHKAPQITIDASTRLSVTMKLTAGGRITGTATFPTGEALPTPQFTMLQFQPESSWSNQCGSYFGAVCPTSTYDVATGAYTVTHVAPGSYRVATEFYFPLSREIVRGYYGGTDIGSADDITIHGGETLRDINIVFGATGFDGAITGTVTSNGVPLAGIVVGLYGGSQVSNLTLPFLTTTTDAQGRYALNGLSVGFYSVGFRDPQGHYATTFYYNPNGPLFVSGLRPTPNIDVAFTPAGRIRGRILTSYGEPQGDYRIFVHESYYSVIPYYDVVTNDDGTFEIKGVAPGIYLVSGVAPEIVANPFNIFYPGTYDAFSAIPITVEAGKTVEGINIPFGHPPGTRLPFIDSGKVSEEAPVP